jgi:hypothetical protein
LDIHRTTVAKIAFALFVYGFGWQMHVFATAQSHTATPPTPLPNTSVVIFWEERFPTADAAPPDRASLTSALPEARFANADDLPLVLRSEQRAVLVLPYGSCIPNFRLAGNLVLSWSWWESCRARWKALHEGG